MLYFLKKFKKRVIDYFFDHPHQKNLVNDLYIMGVTIVGALVFSFGFKAFIQPNYTAFSNTDLINDPTAIRSLASCGASGISQSIVQIIKLLGFEFIKDPFNQYVANFIAYFVVNLPLLIFAFFKIGKKFTLITLFNVICVSLFGIILPNNEGDFITKISEYVYLQPVARVLFAGLCTGFASATSYIIDSTAGGTDIIAYYISEKKSSGVGKWSACINFIVVLTFTILSTLNGGLVDGINFFPVDPATAVIVLLYTFLYMVITTIVVDHINVFNKKLNVQIITKSENLSQIIISNIPHGCTLVKGYGGYTGKQVYLVSVTVRKNECKKVVKIAKKADPSCFINVFANEQVYGKFFRKPIK